MANAVRRCAIYTRKSSEEGLEQDYSSLHAQREACEAFIRSQAGEGWRLIKTAYNDGGFCGRRYRAAWLQQLLANIRAGLVDTVVVYKVDRLTRSLTDFARMVELFDAKGVSFVAVTQQFNTTTSMGSADPQRAALIRAVRARSDRRTNPRQGRRLQAQGHLDGRRAAAWLRRPRAQAGGQAR